MNFAGFVRFIAPAKLYRSVPCLIRDSEVLFLLDWHTRCITLTTKREFLFELEEFEFKRNFLENEKAKETIEKMSKETDMLKMVAQMLIGPEAMKEASRSREISGATEAGGGGVIGNRDDSVRQRNTNVKDGGA